MTYHDEFNFLDINERKKERGGNVFVVTGLHKISIIEIIVFHLFYNGIFSSIFILYGPIELTDWQLYCTTPPNASVRENII